MRGRYQEAVKEQQANLGLDPHACTAEQRNYLRVIFTTLDADSSGFVSLPEMGPEPKWQQIFAEMAEMATIGGKNDQIGLEVIDPNPMLIPA